MNRLYLKKLCCLIIILEHLFVKKFLCFAELKDSLVCAWCTTGPCLKVLYSVYTGALLDMSQGPLVHLKRCISGPYPEVHYSIRRSPPLDSVLRCITLLQKASLDHVLQFITAFTGVQHWTMSQESLLCS